MKKNKLITLMLSSSMVLGLGSSLLLTNIYNTKGEAIYAQENPIVDPPVEPADPPAAPVEPVDPPVDPVEPVDPPVDPVDPPVVPADPFDGWTEEEIESYLLEKYGSKDETDSNPEEDEPGENEEGQPGDESSNEEEGGTVTPPPVIWAPLPTPVYTQPPISNTPSDIVRVPTRPSTPQIVTEETDSDTETEVEEEIDLLKGHYIVYNWNIFTSEEDAQEFIDIIEEDEEAEGQLEYELEKMNEELYILRVSYSEDAEPQGKWILFYVGTMYKTPEVAQEYMEHILTIYPDIFFAGEIVEVGGFYNVILGIRVKADTQALTYDEESFDIDYQADREEFTYTVKADEETGEFIDPIPEAVEEAFPGKFTFTQEEISDTEIEVTMTPVETNDENTADEDTEIELDIQEETTADDSAE